MDQGSGADQHLRGGAWPSREGDEVRRLRFAVAEVEAEFLAEDDAGNLGPARLCVAISGVLYPVFGLLDGYARPEALAFVLVYRYGVVGTLSLAVWLASHSEGFLRRMQATMAVYAAIVCVGPVMFAAGSHPILEPHCRAILMTTFLFVNLTMRLRLAAASCVTASTWLGYAALRLAGGSGESGPVGLDLAFLAIPATFGLLIAYSAEKTARMDFARRRVIREKSDRLEVALREVEARRREAEVASRTDPLTSLYNRRHFFSVAGDGAGPAGPLSVIILDVDHFKSVNDRHGHAVGDQVLRAVAGRIRAGVRPGDVACRYGGEEFAVLLPGAGLLDAVEVAERLRAAIKAEPVATEKGPVPVSISVGVAATVEGGSPLDLLVDRADQALYQAKHGGRDAVRIWRAEGSMAAG